MSALRLPQHVELSSAHRRALADLKARLDALLGSELRALLLYGSHARGEADAGSDVDVAVVVSELTRERRDRILATVAVVEVEHLTPLSTLLLSTADLDHLRRRERRLAADLDREGIPI